MVFSSIIFVFVFFPLVLIGHTVLYLHAQNKKEKGTLTSLMNLFLLLSSLIFYAWGEPKLVIVLILFAYFNYHFALLIERNAGRKIYFTLGIIFNLSLLAYFKYAMLFINPKTIALFNKILPQSLNIGSDFNIILPLGISFFTFQAISYLFDVYRKEVVASQSLIDFACYKTMFPQLVAGPIVRYSQISKELKKRTLSLQIFSDGITRFIIGLAKKVLIADTLGKVADAAFAVPNGELSAYGSWIGIICYTFQIYYDFSGYSDMAIGMGKMLGFSFPENFNYPYIANSIQDFWKRWHMSLSTWFRDYFYIPLGGNRKGKYRTYFNLFLVFLLCGFWHGANWTFMAWGAYYGLFLVLERLIPNLIQKTPKIIRHFYVVMVIVFGWVLFRSDSFLHASVYFKSMFGAFSEGIQMNSVWLVWYGNDVKIALILAVLFSFPVYHTVTKFMNQKEKSLPSYSVVFINVIKYASVIILFLVSLMPLFGATYNAFIYYRF